METEPTKPGGFVLEGVRADYSGSMSVFLCAVRFGRLAAMGPPTKSRVLDRCGRVLCRCGRVLCRCGRVLDRCGRVLDRRGQVPFWVGTDQAASPTHTSVHTSAHMAHRHVCAHGRGLPPASLFWSRTFCNPSSSCCLLTGHLRVRA